MGAGIQTKTLFRNIISSIWYTQGPKFARNHSISNSFQNNRHFPFLVKFKMAARTREIKKFAETLYPESIEREGPKLLKIALSLTVFEIINNFNFQQNSRWWPEFGKYKIFQRYFISRV